MGRPGPLTDVSAAGPHMKDAPSKGYRLAEFTYPILPPHEGGAMWFYSCPTRPTLPSGGEDLADYLGAVKYGNIFSLDVGPDYERPAAPDRRGNAAQGRRNDQEPAAPAAAFTLDGEARPVLEHMAVARLRGGQGLR